MTFLNTSSFLTFNFLSKFLIFFRAMTSPSMKSIDKKTPEKKAPGTEGEVHQESTAEQQETPGMKLNLNNFAWWRVFTFARSLCKSY